ncbi:MAG: acyl-ACP desaturase [Actinobacteria bacterium]|nr:MAG: acyl-ACP desaturase [Actinomycetota bacterium]
MQTVAAPNDVLRELEPAVEGMLERHLSTAQEWFPHEYVPWEQGRSFTDEPWELGHSRLSGVARTAMELNLLTEDNLPYYHLAIWETFGGEGAWGEWVRRWTAEEGRHSIAMRDFLMVTRGVDPVELERGRMDHVSRGYYPAGDFNALDGLVYVTLQELATRISHRNTGAITEDPIAEALMARIALDENLHYVFYRDVTERALEIEPSETILAIHRQVLGFSMPGLELPGFREKAISIAKAGIYDLRIHHDQVLTPVLFKKWRLEDVSGLTDEAERARDEVVQTLRKIDAAATRFEEKRAS